MVSCERFPPTPGAPGVNIQVHSGADFDLVDAGGYGSKTTQVDVSFNGLHPQIVCVHCKLIIYGPVGLLVSMICGCDP